MIEDNEEDDPKTCVCVRCGARAQAVLSGAWRTTNGGRDPICPHCAPRTPGLSKVHSTLAEWRDAPVLNKHEVRTVLASAAGVKLVVWDVDGRASARFDSEQAAADALRTGTAVFTRKQAQPERKAATCEAAGGLAVATFAS